jgi:tubby-related protein 1
MDPNYRESEEDEVSRVGGRVSEEGKSGARARPQIPAGPPTIQAPPVIANLVNAMSQMREFITSPVPKGTLMNCTIKRNKSGGNRIYPKYFLTVSDAGTFLLSGKKKLMKYIISANENKCKVKSSEFMGKVTNNMMGTEFRLYDNGVDPKKNPYNKRYIREELGVVLYKSNIVGKKGPRKMTILIPQVSSDGEPVSWKPEKEEDSMLSKYKAQENMGIHVFKNKKPVWNDTIGAYVLNFNGRVELASVKNFQLVDQFDENKIYLQFGRVEKHVFNLDFIWPFTPIQAFQIALSSIDFKLACE